ncbi:hypothetical protein KAR91_22100 [Candidatus Pacearchaeota archaeon]|nr:hypothetical protein [Candidatus Pacearchaeota archaeon]
MREIIKITPHIFLIDSEPGDATYYSYLVYRDGPDEFTLAPRDNHFRYPQRLDYWEVKDINHEGLLEYAGLFNCNYYTVMECIDAIINIWRMEEYV